MFETVPLWLQLHCTNTKEQYCIAAAARSWSELKPSLDIYYRSLILKARMLEARVGLFGS